MATKITAGSAPVGIEQKGVRELARTLRQAGQDLQDLKDANARAAGIVEPVARTGAPVKSGALRATVRSTGTKAAGVIRAGKKSVPYAGPIHFGWPARGIPARPFVADAAKATEERWARVYEDAVQNALNKLKGA